MGTLDSTADWGVPRVAGAVLKGTEVVDRVGDTTRPFPLASVTKVLTALATMVAVEEGIIALDDPAGPPSSTVRHLLAHASGLAPDDRASLEAPGKRRIYSNAGFEWLGDVIGEAAGMPFAHYWTEALVDGLGLEATRLEGSPAHAASSSVDDIVTVLQAVLGNTLLAPETREAMREPQWPGLGGVLPGFGSREPNHWGLGVEVRGAKSPHWTGTQNSLSTWGHFGRSGTFVWVDPSHELSLVILTTRDFGPWAAAAWPPLADAVIESYT